MDVALAVLASVSLLHYYFVSILVVMDVALAADDEIREKLRASSQSLL